MGIVAASARATLTLSIKGIVAKPNGWFDRNPWVCRWAEVQRAEAVRLTGPNRWNCRHARGLANRPRTFDDAPHFPVGLGAEHSRRAGAARRACGDQHKAAWVSQPVRQELTHVALDRDVPGKDPSPQVPANLASHAVWSSVSGTSRPEPPQFLIQVGTCDRSLASCPSQTT